MFINIVSLFFFLGAFVAQARELEEAVTFTRCVNWESTAAAYEEALAQWKAPSCYTFTMQYTGFSEDPARTVIVEHGKSLPNLDEYYYYMRIMNLDDFWNMIQEKCIQGCPTSGSTCDIEYAVNEESGFMYPALLSIEEPSYSHGVDWERIGGFIWRITDVRAVACSDEGEPIQKEEQENAKKVCANWESTAAAYEEAYAQREAPSCYTFTYSHSGVFSQDSVTRTVKHGKALPNAAAYNQDAETLDYFWNLIQEKCIQDCPNSGAHSCDIKYDMNEENGFMYPASLRFDEDPIYTHDETGDMVRVDGSSWRLEDVRAIACSEEDEPVKEDDNTEITDIVNEPCVGWESAAAAYDDAFAYSEVPSCYTFTYSSFGLFSGEESVTHTVVNGKSLQEGGDFKTLDDVWTLIRRKCIRNCPNKGAHFCEIYYAWSPTAAFMYPEFVSIDQNSVTIDDELNYRIENVYTVPCPEYRTEEKAQTSANKKDKKSKNKKSNKNLRKKGKPQKN